MADTDSRTASVGNAPQPSKAASRRGKKKGNKRTNRKQPSSNNTKQSMPLANGASFSESPLDVDYGDNASAGIPSQADNVATVPAGENQPSAPAAPSAPTVNWNNTAGKGAIRTSLRGPTRQSDDNISKSFQDVNDAYWRAASDSSSSSSGNDNDEDVAMKSHESSSDHEEEEQEEGEVREDTTHASNEGLEPGEVRSDAETKADTPATKSPAPQERPKERNEEPQGHYYAEDSDSSYDDEPSDIILNFSGDEQQGSRLEEIHNARKSTSPVRQSSPSNVEVVTLAPTHDMSALASESEARRQTALQKLRAKYPIEPTTLADLTRQDLEKQAKYLFYHLDINAIDLALPIRCIECFQEGHLAEICPNKVCQHCNAWEAHDSRFCPLVRRCQHCRAKGHEREGCLASRRSCHDVPCDLCGSKLHFETECDSLWRSTLPKTSMPPAQIKISVSCAYCAGSGHLFGDCPERHESAQDGFSGMPWSLKGIDPATIINLNTVPYLGGKIGVNKVNGKGNNSNNNNSNKGGSDFRIKGKASSRPGMKRSRNGSSSLSDAEDGGVFGYGNGGGNRLRPIHQLPNRPPIRFNTDIGRGRSFTGGGGNSNMNGRGGGGYRGRGGKGGAGSQRGRSRSPYRSNDSWRPDNRYR
ncbi:hypothetical protein KEM56_006260 [Ascosphaera pollenicola]|nr:hypothetical protein KEM56_006260 [Ascosphaera pollenicola]